MKLMSSLSVFLFCAGFCIQASAQTGGEKMDDLSWWMESAMVGRPESPPTKNDQLTKDEVKSEQERMWKTYEKVAVRLGRKKHLLPVPPVLEIQSKVKPKLSVGVMTSGVMDMPYVLMAKGVKPKDGWPLFISLHGGGQYKGRDLSGPHGWAVNTREWQAQMSLTRRVYQPAGLYFLPRMAHDRWGRWWMKHNIDIFTRVIKLAILFDDVDPNRVYIMGISQGGYGTCHLAPLLADQFAAAGAMAGGMMTVTENLRNLPFRSDIGEKDTMYDRIKLAKKLHGSLDALKSKDPDGYKNVLAVQKGRGHGIDYRLSPSWLEMHTRNPYPKKIVWRCFGKDGVYRDSFYWISLTQTPKQGEFKIVARLDPLKNKVIVTAVEEPPLKEGKQQQRKPLKSANVIVHLNDLMLDLDKEITIELNGKVVFQGKVKRRRGSMMQNLVKRGDMNYAFPVDIELKSE